MPNAQCPMPNAQCPNPQFQMGQQHHNQSSEAKLAALGRVLETLREEENADVLIETTLNYLQEEFEYRLIWIGLYDRLDHRLFGKGGITPTGDTTFLKQRFNLSPGDLLEQVVIQQRPVGVPDLREEIRAGEWRRAAQQFDVQGTLLFPLRCKDRCFGVALLGSHLWGVSPRMAEKAELSMLFGGLGAALYQIEVDWQRSGAKRPDQALFGAIAQLEVASPLTNRLEGLVALVQQFVAPTRTNLYWYSPERRYFWQRVGNWQFSKGLREPRGSIAGITVAEASDFYGMLKTRTLVAIGSGRSPLKVDSTGRLLQKIRARSLLAAPIHIGEELVGFLAVEDSEARIWEEAEKNYVRATAQLVALIAGGEEMEDGRDAAQQDTRFTAQIAQILQSSLEITEAMKACGEAILKRFEVERFIVLNSESGDCTILYQHQVLRRPLAPMSFSELELPLPELGAAGQDGASLAIEDLEGNERFPLAKEALLAMGVRSLLICPTSNRGAVLIAQSSPRTWTGVERMLMNVVAQQLGLLLSLSSQRQEAARLAQQYQGLKEGIRALCQKSPNADLLDKTWLQYLATLLESPLVALLSWGGGKEATPTRVHLATVVCQEARFALPPDLSVPLNDALIAESIRTKGFRARSLSDLPLATRSWLNSPGIGQVLVVRGDLSSLILVGDESGRRWSSSVLKVASTLLPLFALCRQLHSSNQQLGQSLQDCQVSNWYSRRSLERLQASVIASIGAMRSLESTPKTQGIEGGESLRQMREVQIRRGLEGTIAGIAAVLEQSSSSTVVSPVPMANLLARSLRRLESAGVLHQVQYKVYGDDDYRVYAESLKLDYVLQEILEMFGSRVPLTRLDFFFKEVSPLLELLIVENGAITTEIEPIPTPNVSLEVCQTVLLSWGGSLMFYEFEGKRWCRLVLAIAT